MAKTIEGLYYSESHEYVKVEGEYGYVGITDYAQEQLGNVVYVASLLAYYKDHYEDIERSWDVNEKLKIEVVDERVLLRRFSLKALYIDRNGNYGWLVNLIWSDNPITVVLSGDN